MLPILAVQIAPAPAFTPEAMARESGPARETVPALEEQLLRACSAGLERARCVSARRLGDEAPRGIAVVSWTDAEHVSIQVGLARGEQPLWVSRELDFIAADPESERWRAVGFTIALLADDPRFWPEPEPEPPARVPVSPVDVQPPGEPRAGTWLAEVRGLGGSGVVSGPMRWGAELRLSAPLSSAFFATASVDYAVASDTDLDVRWFDASLGAGLAVPLPFAQVDARFRLELLAENVAVAVQRAALSEQRSAWVPGVSVGSDLLVPIAAEWLLSARADVFWLDGSTAIVSASEKIGTVAGAGLLLGLGAGYRF